jgi:small subunit ribosomal protein S1
VPEVLLSPTRIETAIMRKNIIDAKATQLLNEELIQDQFSLSTAQETSLNNLYQEHGAVFAQGQLFTGKVLSRSSNGVIVDVAFKSYGTIPNNEFNSQELASLVDGATIEVLVDRLEDEHGSVVLSYQKAKSMKAWDRIVDLAKEDKPVSGIVLGKVKGGLNVDIGIPAFLPGSQVDVQRINDFDQFVGQEIICKILKINKKRGNVIISRRRFLESERQANKSKVMTNIVEGQVIQGIAKNITNYGVFVDIGGVDGLLHITDMSWGRVSHPSELIKIGDSITVKVIGLDREHEKISLGIKQLSSNPWDEVEKLYPLNSVLTGKISSITEYGLFVEIAAGVEGLVHISEVSWTERITNLHRHFQVGKEVQVVVITLDKQNRRMSLSIKQLTQDPWKTITEKYKAGDRISGKVSNVTDFGVFVELSDGIDGLVHVSDISWTDHISHPGELYKKGDSVEAVIISIDSESKKISLGIKQLHEDPWSVIETLFPVGTVTEGVVSKLTSFGAFVRMGNGIEGLIHSSELNDGVTVKIGETVNCKVIKVNTEDRKLGLSVKALDPNYNIQQGQPSAENTERRKQQQEAATARKKASEAKPAVTSMKSVLQQALQEHADRIKADKE